MSARMLFPFFSWTVKNLSGPWARRIYLSAFLLALCFTTVARVRGYLMARPIQAVLHGLSQIQVDQTTEEQRLKTVPYLKRGERNWGVGGVVRHGITYRFPTKRNGSSGIPILMIYLLRSSRPGLGTAISHSVQLH